MRGLSGRSSLFAYRMDFNGDYTFLFLLPIYIFINAIIEKFIFFNCLCQQLEEDATEHMCHTYSFVKSLKDQEQKWPFNDPPERLVSNAAKALCRTILRYEKCGCGNILKYLTCCKRSILFFYLTMGKLLLQKTRLSV